MIMKRQDHGPHLNYIVRRGFTADDEGNVSPGYKPSPQRLAKWSNLAALVNSGYLAIDASREDASREDAGLDVQVEKKITARTTKKKISPCPMPGCKWKGERVKSHLTRSHKEI